jgi:hypothetical protein
MPIEYQRDDERRRITVTVKGRVTTKEVLAIVARQAADKAWSYGTLYDSREGIDVPTADDLRQLVCEIGALTTRYGPRGPVALVVLEAALYKMARRYAALGDLTALNVGVFGNVAEAERWLDREVAASRF